MGISGKFALKGAGCVAKTSFAGFAEGDELAVGVVSRGVTDGDGFAVGEGVILGVGEYVEELVGDGESLGDRLGEALAEAEGK